MQGIPLSLLNNGQVTDINTSNVNVAALKEENERALLDLIKGLSNGETLLGKVLSSTEEAYTIKTLDLGVTIDAKAENGVILEKGSTVLFEVNKLSDSEVSLRPLNINTSTSVTAESALKAAGLPVNNRSLELTVRNMEYGNPIDKRSLVESYRDVALNPETPVKYVVDLQKMQIPVTPQNLEQYEAYLNMKNVFVEDFAEIAETLADSLVEDTALGEGEAQEAAPKLAANLDTINRFAEALDKNSSMPELSEALKELTAQFEEAVERHVDSVKPQVQAPNQNPAQQANVANETVSERPVNVPREPETVNRNPIEITVRADTPEKLTADLKTSLREVFERVFTNNLTLSEQELPDKAKIKDLYERLYSETRKISSALEEVLPKDNPAAPKVTLINNNIDFMNALNNFIPYVQIPFRGESGARAGELYVYRNRTSKSIEGDEVSAFLHLDMDYLGPTDVYVKMKGSNVNTEFTLADEESLDFIEKNMDFLTKRLSDKGYALKAEGHVKERTKTPIEEAFEQSISKVLIARTSFDARI
ncbi:MAG: flagellar hook-length control protein FliK [Lachnospiraceae bacterium]|nr:flagellar hook-length control protein FliK [Lachnospiraceae bacterium]